MILDFGSAQPTNFSWVDPFVAASGRPMSRREIFWLKGEGIRIILNLTDRSLPSKWGRESGIEFRHVSIKNHQGPTTAHLSKAVAILMDAIKSDNKILVHCDAGSGRTGMVLASYLVSVGIPYLDAIKRVREARPGSIERHQERSVAAYVPR